MILLHIKMHAFMQVCTQTCVHVKVREQLQRLFLKGRQFTMFPRPCPPIGLEVTNRQRWLAREPQASAHLHLHKGYKNMCYHAWFILQEF